MSYEEKTTRHGQNSHQRTQMGGWLKRRSSKRQKTMLFFSVLVILPSDETLFHHNLPPRGYNSNDGIFLQSF
ncbi:hypothetical protein AMECASPLE_013024 [Ameca splendens]|uniref:Uncharacterized protein n=1 Tax=Ameca splendens TaxID=208324 RepID=A0ABV0YNA5_9TELE